MTLAPIALFTYNRLWHTQRTIESLLLNPESSQSVLYIFSDAPKTKSDAMQVEELRTYLKKVTGFKQVQYIFREENFGLAKSIIQGVTEILASEPNVIVLEDDLVSSPHFLKYMNESLALYESSTEVIAIHGYTPAVDSKGLDTFFLKGADSWGWATWSRAWKLFEKDGQKLLNELEQKKMTSEFDFNDSFPYTEMLRNQIAGKNNSWAIRWQATAFINNMLSLYPGKSLIQNIGFDGSGTHCSPVTIYDTSLTPAPIFVYKIPTKQNDEMFKTYAHFFKRTQPSILKRILNKLQRTLKKL